MMYKIIPLYKKIIKKNELKKEKFDWIFINH